MGYASAVRSPFAPVAVALAALIASLVRWWVQGSGNVYTALDKRFYVPDPDLGWRISVQHPIWLGLEVCAIIAGIVGGLAIGGWMIKRLEARRRTRITGLRIAAWSVAIVSLAVPIAAFASGPGPVGGVDLLPGARAVAFVEGMAGSLDAPAGRYEVVAHPGTAITAHLSAGREAFDARFTGDVRGFWQGDPRDLAQPMTAEISVAAASIDTGVGERSKHARDAYLLAERYPRIELVLDRLIAAHQVDPSTIAFRARATVALIGKRHAVELAGTLKRPDATALGRLGISGTVLVAQAELSLVIKETALAPDAGDFDGDRIPIHVSLVLRRTND
jgi:hypothetical protein